MHSINSRVFAPATSRSTESGIARAMFRVAVSGRREQEASFFTVIVWRDQAEHAVESLAKGSRVVVVGRLRQRSWTAEDGSARSAVEVVAEDRGRAYGGRRRRPPGRRGARTSSDSCSSPDQPIAVGGGPSLWRSINCVPQAWHSRYHWPSGPRMRCQRWSRSLHRQGLAIAVSLGIGHTGSSRPDPRLVPAISPGRRAELD
jgi:single stranded DNA-binding protein